MRHQIGLTKPFGRIPATFTYSLNSHNHPDLSPMALGPTPQLPRAHPLYPRNHLQQFQPNSESLKWDKMLKMRLEFLTQPFCRVARHNFLPNPVPHLLLLLLEDQSCPRWRKRFACLSTGIRHPSPKLTVSLTHFHMNISGPLVND